MLHDGIRNVDEWLFSSFVLVISFQQSNCTAADVTVCTRHQRNGALGFGPALAVRPILERGGEDAGLEMRHLEMGHRQTGKVLVVYLEQPVLDGL